jgi:CheY-like chemotaxis protein
MMKAARILIAEDDAVLVAHLCRVLREMGYEVAGLVATAKDAATQAAALRADVVLMDICLRGPQTGIDAAAELRRRTDIPVIYLTAHAEESLVSAAKLTQPYGYLAKPVRDHELRAGIEVALYRSRMERQLRHRNEVLRAIRDVHRLMVRESDPQGLMEQACELIMRIGHYPLAWIRQPPPGGFVVPPAMAAPDRNTLDLLAALAEAVPDCVLSADRSLRTRPLPVVQDLSADSAAFPWRGPAARCGVTSAAFLPLWHADQSFGVLGVVSAEASGIDDEELQLLTQLGEDLGVGLCTAWRRRRTVTGRKTSGRPAASGCRQSHGHRPRREFNR